ncbi:HypC/HybG/HupF family hydrogenase formation chaperone [Pelagicoccus mobilis]|uniref:HypC/HybG/HupF family hydrogenase formation chaperone n=1 Tax=Pelagicoccus mobilis TaxID=415221 RepID=A0A934VQ87_9BACT|nr:HypC/HybG/HupF family hydrogenase formation chaperone [Pelagicoccus mobilis]MBK1876244.1 HypC/HybG/HupF family hydrogenase formation chaperone [Pelagicoccus mobilis]
MCLAIPGKIVSITEEDAINRQGIVDFEGIRNSVNLSFLPEATNGDYVLVHVGFAISQINEEHANSVFETLREMDELEDLKEESP